MLGQNTKAYMNVFLTGPFVFKEGITEVNLCLTLYKEGYKCQSVQCLLRKTTSYRTLQNNNMPLNMDISGYYRQVKYKLQ